jgi:DNA-binding MarR family transcriptional regulator
MAKKPAAISKHDYEILASFRYALRMFLRFSEEAAHETGLTPQQHQALLVIKGFPGRDQVTVGELAERLQIRHHSAVGLADRLVKHKYLARTRDSKDHRVVYVGVTARGEKVLEKLTSQHREQLRRLEPQIKSVLKALQGPKS